MEKDMDIITEDEMKRPLNVNKILNFTDLAFTKCRLDHSTVSLQMILIILKACPNDTCVTHLKYSWKIYENKLLTYRLIQNINGLPFIMS